MIMVSFQTAKRENAYLTVEATLIMVLVLPFILFLMSWMFFFYNRCLLEQESEVLALRGSVWKGSKEILLDEIRIQENSLDQEKFVALNKGKLKVKIEGNKLILSQTATTPLWGGSLFKIGGNWKIQVTSMNHRLDEIVFLRACRKVKQGREE